MPAAVPHEILPKKSQLAVIATLTALLIAFAADVFFGQVRSSSTLRLDSGEQIYKAACMACHGPDGKGTPKTISAFDPPRTFPDFTQCDQTTPEPNTAWKAVITNGGSYRGFSQIMPSFAEALTLDQIQKVMQYLREQCPEPHWPLGEQPSFADVTPSSSRRAASRCG